MKISRSTVAGGTGGAVGGVAPTITHCHDSDTASANTVYSQVDTTAARYSVTIVQAN